MKRILTTLSMLLFGVTFMLAQRVVKGMVSSAEGEALIGASVRVGGTTRGTVTDVNGNYSVEVPSGATKLIYSYTGYDTQEIALGASNVVDVTMSEGKLITEAVVTALGISKSAKTLGYATTVVSGDQINLTKNVSALDALNGKVSGLTISTASSAPGASTVVNIRGFTSVTGNNQPLFVVDGVPMNNRGNTSSNDGAPGGSDFSRSMDFGNQMNDLNPNDIESINVLKGSAASALYGSRAAGGVILIQTKRGKEGKIKVDFNTSLSTQELLRVPHLQNTYGQGWSGLFAYEENGSWGPRTDDQVRLWGNVVNNSQQLKPFSIQENNLADFMDRGSAFTSGISLSGGTEKTNFRLSYSYATADGIVPTDADSYKRNTVSLSGGTKYGKLAVNSVINYVKKNQKAVATGQGQDAGGGNVLWQEIIQMPRDHSIVDYEKYNDPNDPATNFYNLDNFFTPYAQNPYWTLHNQGNNFNEDRVFGNLELSYDLMRNMKLIWRGGGDFSNAFQKDWGNLGRINPGTPNSTANNVAGGVAEFARRNAQLNSDLLLTYDRDLAEKWNMNVTLGHNINQRSGNSVLTRVTNLGIPDFFNLSNSTVPPSSYTNESLRRLIGVFGSASFGYANWAYLTVGARNDWSSTLPAGNNSYFYPNASVSMVLNQAMALPKQVDYLKVRAGYARTGNDADPYLINPVYVPGDTRAGGFANVVFPFASISSFEVGNNLGNPALKPELTDETEFGVEAKFFKSRLGFDFTYYDKLTNNQIINLLVEAASGFRNQTVNLGSVSNKGIELMVNVVPVRTKSFEWGFNVNYSKNKNNVESLGLTDETSILLNSSYDVDLKAEVGKPLGAIYSPQAATDGNGNVVVNPETGLPQLADKKAYRGSINPDFTVGAGSYMSFKGFTLGGDIDYRKGGVFYSYTARLNYFVGNAYNTQYNDRQPWVIPNSVVSNGDGTFSENTTPISRANVFTYYGANDAYQYNHVLDKTFFKLRNVYLNYALPKKLIEKAGIGSGSVGVFGRNLALWTPSENHFVDPESNTFGTDLSSLYGEFATGPAAATYGIQLNVSF